MTPARPLAPPATVALAAILLAACAGSSPPGYAAAIQEGRSAAEEMIAQDRGSAIAVALVDRDRTIWSEGFGLADRASGQPATAGTLFSIASASKMLAAVAVMRLVDEGLVDLEAPVVRYVPGFAMLSPAYRDVTVGMLLDHSSGFPGTDYRDVQTVAPRTGYLDQVTTSLSQEWLKAGPGTTNVYCNDGFTLLEAVVQAVTGRPYVDYVEERVLAPLGMTRTGFALAPLPGGSFARVYENGEAQPQDFLNAFASGGAWSTAEDMGSLARMFLGRGALGKVRVLSEAGVAAMAEDRTVGKLHPVRSGEFTFGLGWDSVAQPGLASVGVKGWTKGGDTELGHYGAALLVAPEEGLGVVVLGTAGLGSAGATAVAERVLLRALAENGRIPAFPAPLQKVIPAPGTTPDGLLASISGVYATGAGLFVLDAGPGGSLVVARGFLPGDGSSVAWSSPGLLPYRADGTFASDANPLEAWYVTDGGGTRFLAKRAPSGWGHYVDASEQGQRIVAAAAPTTPAWAARVGQVWLVVNDGPDSVYWPRADPRLRLATIGGLGGRVAVSPRGDPLQLLDASADDTAARGMQPTGRDLDDLVIVPRDGEEWMRQGSYLHRPVASVALLPRGATTPVPVGPEGWAEWRDVEAGPEPVAVGVTGAVAWALYDAGFGLVASGRGAGEAELPAGSGRGHLLVHGLPGSAVGVAVE